MYIRLISSVLLIGCFTLPAPAQVLRRPRITPPPAPIRTPITPFFGFNNGINTAFIAPALVRSTSGAFNPATGAFAPTPGSPFVLSRRGGFEPLNGSFVPAPDGQFLLRVREAYNPVTNSYFPSTAGNFVFRERGTFTPSSGSFTQSASGSFNPFTGAFVPGGNGGFTLSSRGLFVPAGGAFVPSPMGNFMLTARESFNPATGTFVPSANGTFTTMSRGNFIPTTGTLPSTGSIFAPGSQSNFSPLNQAFTLSPFFHTWRANMALAAQQAINPYGVSNPYFASTSYPSPYAYPNSYGGAAAPYGNGAGYVQASNAAPQTNVGAPPSPEPKKQLAALAVLGIPSENGAVQWPLAFRLMSVDDRQKLLDPLDLQLQSLASQVAADKTTPSAIRRVQLSLEKVEQWLRSRKVELAEGTFQDGVNFMARLESALQTARTNY